MSFINNFFGQSEKPKRKSQLNIAKAEKIEQPRGSVKYKDYYFIDIKPSNSLDKKYDAIFMKISNGKSKIVSFGDPKIKDYTQHKDKKLLQEYQEKHKGDNKKDMMSAATLNSLILWNKSSVSGAIKEYKENLK